VSYQGRLCTIPQAIPQGWSPAQARDEYFRALADYEDCERRIAAFGPRVSRHELYQHEQRLRRIRSLIESGGGQRDTMPYIPGEREEREMRIWRDMTGMG
jgi:hypothetical protein